MIALVAGILRAIANGLERESKPAEPATPAWILHVDHLHIVDQTEAQAVAAKWKAHYEAGLVDRETAADMKRKWFGRS